MIIIIIIIINIIIIIIIIITINIIYINKWQSPFVRSFVRLYVHSFVHSFIRSFIHSFIHTFIHTEPRGVESSPGGYRSLRRGSSRFPLLLPGNALHSRNGQSLSNAYEMQEQGGEPSIEKLVFPG